MSYTIKESGNGWSNRYISAGVSWPSENVIRIFKGNYPRLNLDKDSYCGRKIIDIGCGDVGNLLFFNSLGLELYGVEITKSIVEHVKKTLQERGVKADIRLGENRNIPFESDFFDYLLSWNAVYYMGEHRDFGRNVAEFSRILKFGGYLIMSIPKITHEIFKNAKIISDGFVQIQVDRLGIRIGEVFRQFKNTEEIEKAFSPHFKDFCFGSVEDDYFGIAGHWHLVVCTKK